MWEYSINICNSNKNVLKYIYSSIKNFATEFSGLVAINEEKYFSSVIIGVADEYKEKMQNCLSSCIVKTICSFYKMQFLNNNLSVSTTDDLLISSFKRALINFDKETDYYIISRNIDYNSELFLDSFYNFKLKKLRDKWEELINLANENREYLFDKDSFMDLLKFLIDNIDIMTGEIDIIQKEDGYKIFSTTNTETIDIKNDKDLMSFIIDSSPNKINFYHNEDNKLCNLLSYIYEKRIKFFEKEHNDEKSVKIFKKL